MSRSPKRQTTRGLQQALAGCLKEADDIHEALSLVNQTIREALSLVDPTLEGVRPSQGPVKADGNCLSTVLAMALTEQGFEPGSMAKLRAKFVGEVKKNPELA